MSERKARISIPLQTEAKAAEQEMPVPGQNPQSFSYAGGNGADGSMPTPTMHRATSSEMPMPGQPNPSGGSEMPMPAMHAASATAGMPSGDGAPSSGMYPSSMEAGGSDAPRFKPENLPPGESAPATFEPGIVEVQFREGLRPEAAPYIAGAPCEIRATAGPPMADVNRILRDYNAQKVEPTFLISHEEATEAQTSAQTQGLDAPNLANFFTLHFAPNADVRRIAEELKRLPEVEVAVPVPRAIPPSAAVAPMTVTEPPVAPAPLPPASPFTEPFTGINDQAVIGGSGVENQWYIFRCRVNQAWARSSGSGVVIADVDWGYRITHEDLAAKIEPGGMFNAFDGGTNVTTGGSVSHGTAVLGLTGAAVNDRGIAGVAYGAKLWAIQSDSGPGPSLGGNPWARGIDWVRTTSSGGRRKVVILEVQTGAFGNYEQVPSVNAAIKTAIAAGVVVCVAAGNGDRDAGIDDSGNPIPPTGSILVGATAYHPTQNARAGFSNFGSQITVCAPGDGSHDVTCNSTSDTAYRNGFGGTSGATPKVAGVAALMLSLNPSLTHAQIRSILTATGSAVVTTAGKPVGTFLNAEGAVQQTSTGAVGRLAIFARGSDQAVWIRSQTAPSNGWGGWSSMGGWVDRLKPARNADGRLEIFARGSDAAVWHKWQTSPGGGFSGWSSLGGWIDILQAGQNADGRIELFVRGSDQAVWHKWQTAPNGPFGGWASLGGWVDLIEVAQNADGRLHLFARGSDKAVWHKWQTAPNNGWSGWASLGGWVDIIKVGRNADGRLEIFARGSDGAVWHKWQTSPGGAFSGWVSLGGWVDLIDIGKNADGRLEIFARGSDKAVWHKWQTAPNNGWSGWSSLGGWVDRLEVNSNADGRMELFVRGSDGAVWHKWQTAPSNGWSGWSSLGGWIDLVDTAQNAT